jgi:hypothetical protein
MLVLPPKLFETALHRYAFERELGSGGMAVCTWRVISRAARKWR